MMPRIDTKLLSNRDRAVARLRSLRDCKDIETAHGDADDVLCELLASLGYDDVVAAWHDVPKWYA